MVSQADELRASTGLVYIGQGDSLLHQFFSVNKFYSYLLQPYITQVVTGNVCVSAEVCPIFMQEVTHYLPSLIHNLSSTIIPSSLSSLYCGSILGKSFKIYILRHSYRYT